MRRGEGGAFLTEGDEEERDHPTLSREMPVSEGREKSREAPVLEGNGKKRRIWRTESKQSRKKRRLIGGSCKKNAHYRV